MSYEVTIIQASKKSVAVSGYKYVFILKHPTTQKPKALATRSIFELSQVLYRAVDETQWQSIEAGLSLTGAWRGEIEIDDVTASHIFSNL